MAAIVKGLKSFLGLTKEEQPAGPKDLQEVIDSLPASFHAYMAAELPFRRASALAFLLIVFCLGGPLWWHTTRTYRAPFEVFQKNQSVPVTINVIMAATDASIVNELPSLSEELLFRLQSAEVIFPLVIEWKVENIGLRSLDDVSERGVPSSLDVRAALIPSNDWPHFSATHVYLGRGPWAMVQWNKEDGKEKLMHRLTELVLEVMVDVPHLNSIVRRDLRQRMQPWQIASLPLSHQKRLVWDSAPLAMHYLVQVVHVHDNSSPRQMTSSSTVTVLRRLAAKLDQITTLEVSSEHLWDMEVSSYLEKDVQDRWTLSHAGMEKMIMDMDAQLETVESAHPLLRIAILETEHPVIMLDQYDEDSQGAAVAAWGAVVPRSERTDGRVMAAMRVLLGLDAELNPGWTREAVPLCDWEMSRMQLRAVLDNAMRAITAVGTLKRLTEKITNVVVEDEVADWASSAVRTVEGALGGNTVPSLKEVSEGRRLADEALSHPSLLSLLYFPQDQKVAVYIPIMLPTLLPLFGSIWTLTKWMLGKR